MKKQTKCLVLMAAAVLCTSAFAQDPSEHQRKPAAVLNLDDLIQEALQSNPDITASQKKRDALWERPPQAKCLPTMPTFQKST